MRRGPKPAKSKEAKPPVARKSPKDDARVRDLEKRLAEALKLHSDSQEQLKTRDRELVEALQQQTATSEILRVISSSPTDEQPVFEAIVQNARQICEATFSVVLLVEAGQLTLAAVRGVDEAGIAALQRAYPQPITRDTTSGRAV